MLRYIVSSKINNKPLTYTKYDFSITVEKMESWIGRTVHGPVMHPFGIIFELQVNHGESE